MISCLSLLKRLLICIMSSSMGFSIVYGQVDPEQSVKTQLDSLEELAKIKQVTPVKVVHSFGRVAPNDFKLSPYVSLGEMLKGRVSGLLVQTPSGEPGSYQNIMVRGITAPLFSNKDIINNQAAIFVNGIPTAMENNFAYNIQRYDFNRIGPATDYGTSIDIGSIKSIEVIKDPVRLAELGPFASNGAIWIITTEPTAGTRNFSFNSYFGMAGKPQVSPINADYESKFRNQYYDKYASQEAIDNKPDFLKDKQSEYYYGPANWQDLYYRNPVLYSVDLSLTGGNQRANFGFFASHSKNANTADETQLQRYNVLFAIRMLPFKWLKASSYVNARKVDRNRNKNVRDRLSEMDYISDLSSPLSPNKLAYGHVLNVYDDLGLDENGTNFIQGRLDLAADILPNLQFTTSFLMDYFEGSRSVFYPKALMDDVNFTSGYNGYTQRFIFSNKVKYNQVFNQVHKVHATVGSDYSEDLYRYLYSRVYNGPSDYIRKNIVSGSSDELEGNSALTVYRWNNRERFHLHSIYGKVDYTFHDYLTLSGVVRADGASTVQADSRWLLTPGGSIQWDIANFFKQKETFRVALSYSRIGKPTYSSRYATGPQYQSDLGWEGNPSMFSYFGHAALSRGYSFGWVGYDLKWAHTDRFQASLTKSAFDKRMEMEIALYREETNNQIALVPIPQEYGYAGQYLNGLGVRNEGVELSLSASILKPTKEQNKLNWQVSFNGNLNRNQVIALPNNLSELQVGQRMLQVGKPVDSFWLYENTGIYSTNEEIPVNSQTNTKLSYKGIPFEAGDAKWVDSNQDYVINDEDRVVKGRFTPYLFGGFTNTMRYHKINFDFSLSYALGNQALNNRAANRLNFIEREQENSINSVHEIFHWQEDVKPENYPLYNVWSTTQPYQVNQDLFLEDASYIKLRAVTVGYDFASMLPEKHHIRRALLYLTGNNLLTITKFSGNDPELINFNGIYDGYGLPLSQSLVLGIKLDF